MDGHLPQVADRLASTRARCAAAARAIRSAGTATHVPKDISSGVCPRNAECGRTRVRDQYRSHVAAPCRLNDDNSRAKFQNVPGDISAGRRTARKRQTSTSTFWWLDRSRPSMARVCHSTICGATGVHCCWRRTSPLRFRTLPGSSGRNRSTRGPRISKTSGPRILAAGGRVMTPVPSDRTAARLRQLSERVLSADEVRAYLEAPIAIGEREDILSQIRWFRRRYPSPADRLAYIRRAYARWRP